MSQRPIGISAYDDTDRSITIAFASGKRVEYLLGDSYYILKRQVPMWMDNSWYNHIIARLTEVSTAIYGDGVRLSKEQLQESLVTDYKSTPSQEYPFTVIATTARGVTYNGGRKWYKTQDDAIEFAGEVFEGESKQNFELAIVQCVDVVRPKPKTVLMSTFKRDEPKVMLPQGDDAKDMAK